MRISDWSSDVCSSDLGAVVAEQQCRQDASGLAIRILLGSGYPGQDLLLESVEVLRGQRRMQHHVGEYSQRRKQRGLECRRSEERGGGQEFVCTCRSRGSPYHYKKKTNCKYKHND